MIKIEGLTKYYSQGDLKVVALAGVDLWVKPGEFVSIMGSSGSGKSTMMNILGCLDKPTNGKYILDGIDISKTPDSKLSEIRNKKIGFVFQSFNLLPKLNALENVELPMIYAGADGTTRYKKAMEALERVGLDKRIKHRPNEMSGGQRQRVAIARALVNNPSIILADEPTGNLDSRSGREVIELLMAANRKAGQTLILITHDENIALQANRILTISDGRIIRDEVIRG